MKFSALSTRVTTNPEPWSSRLLVTETIANPNAVSWNSKDLASSVTINLKAKSCCSFPRTDTCGTRNR